MTGPSSAIQMTAAPMIETIAEADRTRGVAGPFGLGSFGLAAQLTLDGGGDRALVAEHRRREHGEAALLVLGQAGGRERVLDERVRRRRWAVPIPVMSMTCGLPFLVMPFSSLTVALAYSAAMSALARLIWSGSLM